MYSVTWMRDDGTIDTWSDKHKHECERIARTLALCENVVCIDEIVKVPDGPAE